MSLSLPEKTPERPKDSPDYSREYWKLQREDLSGAVGESIELETQEVDINQSIQDYLKTALESDNLVLRALSSLQLQGYHQISLPEGHQIEIHTGKLSIFKILEGGARQYCKIPETGRFVQEIPLLAAIPHREKLYFKSGGYQEGFHLNKKAKNKAEAHQMVEDALKEGRFAKLTGMVNGLKISDKVRLGTRHKVAAQEILFLLENSPSVFDAATMDWMNRFGNLEDLKELAEGQWGDMNRPGTEAFERVRSAEGVVQFTLAWRRLRTVLPANLLRDIRRNSLKKGRLSSLKMSLAQTESTSGKALAEDRKVMVETVILNDRPLKKSLTSKAIDSPAPQPEIEVEEQKPAPPSAEGGAKVSEEGPKVDPGTLPPEKKEESSDQPKEDVAESAQENAPNPSEEKGKVENPFEEIYQEIWEEQEMLFDVLISSGCPEVSITVSDERPGVKWVELGYVSNLKEGGKVISIKQRTKVALPKTFDDDPVYSKDGRELLNPGEVIAEMVDAIKKEIEAPAAKEFEYLMETHILRALPAENIPQMRDRFKENRQEKKAMRAEGKSFGEVRKHLRDKRNTLNQYQEEFIEGNFDSVMDEIRQHYSAKSLKLETLVGKQRHTDTTSFSTGGLGLDPLLISVEKPKDEVGLVFSGAKIKKPIFYSLESHEKYEIDSPSN